MSGGEASLVIGLISGIISIVSASKQVFEAAHDATGLPKAFREVESSLPLVNDTLQAVEKYIEEGPSTATCKAVKPLLERCKAKAETLAEIFKKVIPADDASHLNRYYSAVRALGKGNKVESLMAGILEDVDAIASNRAMRTATAAQLERVSKAIEDLEKLPSSVPDHIFETEFTNINNGHGPQNVHQGTGVQKNYTNSASGTQQNADVMNFGIGKG